MKTNQEKLKELQEQKRELQKQLKSIEFDIAQYDNYRGRLHDYKELIIKELLLDVHNQLTSNGIKIQIVKHLDYLQFNLIKDDQTKNTTFYNYTFATYTVESEAEYLRLKDKFDNDIKFIKQYLLNLSKTLNSLGGNFFTNDELSYVKITRPAIEMGIFKFTYCEGFHNKYIVKLNFSDNNDSLKYTMTKTLNGYSFEQNPKPNHHFKLKSESCENKINIEYSIENTCDFDNLKVSLKNTFNEIDEEFKNITIEID